jgi:hypothetical protein
VSFVTVWQLTAILRRQWLVTLFGSIAVVAFLFHLGHLDGLYYQKVEVIFLAPESPRINTFQNATGSLISTAGVISQVVGSSDSGAAPVAANATLVGTGVKHGYSVRLPNDGGQWAINYTRPVLDVQAVGTSAEEVTATMTAVEARINQELTRREDDFGVRPKYRITTRLSPPIAFVSHSDGSPIRRLAAGLLLGVGLTAGAAVTVDRWRRSAKRWPLPQVREEAPIH